MDLLLLHLFRKLLGYLVHELLEELYPLRELLVGVDLEQLVLDEELGP